MEDGEKESKLIELVRENPCLWDKELDAYKNKLIHEKAWIQIGSLMQMPAPDCEKLWKSVKSQFLSHQRKLKLPSGSSGKKRPFFRHERIMMFLKDSGQSDSTYSNVPADPNRDERGLPVFEEEVVVNAMEGCSSALSDSCVERNRPQSEYRSHTKSKKPKLDDFESELLRTIQSEDKTDEFDDFGRLMATKLRKINAKDPKLCQELQYDITTFIHQSEMKILEN